MGGGRAAGGGRKRRSGGVHPRRLRVLRATQSQICFFGFFLLWHLRSDLAFAAICSAPAASVIAATCTAAAAPAFHTSRRSLLLRSATSACACTATRRHSRCRCLRPLARPHLRTRLFSSYFSCSSSSSLSSSSASLSSSSCSSLSSSSRERPAEDPPLRATSIDSGRTSIDSGRTMAVKILEPCPTDRTHTPGPSAL